MAATRLSTYLTEFPEVVSHPHAPSKDLVVGPLMLFGITTTTAMAQEYSYRNQVGECEIADL